MRSALFTTASNTAICRSRAVIAAGELDEIDRTHRRRSTAGTCPARKARPGTRLAAPRPSRRPATSHRRPVRAQPACRRGSPTAAARQRLACRRSRLRCRPPLIMQYMVAFDASTSRPLTPASPVASRSRLAASSPGLGGCRAAAPIWPACHADSPGAGGRAGLGTPGPPLSPRRSAPPALLARRFSHARPGGRSGAGTRGQPGRAAARTAGMAAGPAGRLGSPGGRTRGQPRP